MSRRRNIWKRYWLDNSLVSWYIKRMKLIRNTPCGDCPFRKQAIAGWIGNWDSANDLLSQAQSEVGLPCHSSYNNGKIAIEEAVKSAHVCVGSLQSARNSGKLYRNPILNAFAKAVGRSESVMNAWEFLKHHTQFLNKKRV